MIQTQKPSLTDFARQTSNQSVVTINLVVVAFLIIVLFVTFCDRRLWVIRRANIFDFSDVIFDFGNSLSPLVLIQKKPENSAISKRETIRLIGRSVCRSFKKAKLTRKLLKLRNLCRFRKINTAICCSLTSLRKTFRCGKFNRKQSSL